MPVLYYITDSSQLSPPGDLVDRIRRAFAAGVDWVQIREKCLGPRALCRLVEQAASLPEKGEHKLLVNERLDVALSCGADGVHLPADSLPPSALRKLVPERFLIGVSCHSLGELRRAAEEKADFAVFGPVFATPGKGSPVGLEMLREACRVMSAIKLPVLGLGGISEQNASRCLDAGAFGIAAIRLFQSGDVSETIRRLRSIAGRHATSKRDARKGIRNDL